MAAPAKRRDIALVVDDSPETLHMLTDALEAAGITVMVALAGQAALDLLDRITPDIILLDAVMPGLDGFTTCRRIKALPALAHVPVIFMTGLNDTDSIVAGLEAGGVDYVAKPIAIGEMLARLTVHLTNARIAHSSRAALDAAGRYLLAVDGLAQVRWFTPQAAALLGAAFPGFAGGDAPLPVDLSAWLAPWLRQAVTAADPRLAAPLTLGRAGDAGDAAALATPALQIAYVGRIGTDEHLLRLSQDGNRSEIDLLRSRLALTQREAEVLLWVARGKSNRDAAQILDLSPRTIEKYLEQIYAKLAVENRTAAASLALKSLETR